MVVVVVVVVVAVGVVVVVVVVVDVVVVVVAVARCFVGTHARRVRARARQTRPQILTHLARARARGARPHIYGREVREPTNEPKNHGIYDVFAASEKIKLKIMIAKKTKTLYFTMFLARRVPKLAFRKALKHRCLQCFGPPPKRKRYVRCFLTLGTPK